MKPEGLLPCSQEPSTDPYPEPDQFSSYHSILSSKIHFNIIHPPSWTIKTGVTFRINNLNLCKLKYEDYAVTTVPLNR
jgi:hypothetical protein